MNLLALMYSVLAERMAQSTGFCYRQINKCLHVASLRPATSHSAYTGLGFPLHWLLPHSHSHLSDFLCLQWVLCGGPASPSYLTKVCTVVTPPGRTEAFVCGGLVPLPSMGSLAAFLVQDEISV